MPTSQLSSDTRTKAAAALLLTFAAGCVDIVGFLTLYHIFTAHMTGVTVHLGEDLLELRWADALKAVSVLTSFLAGSIVGRTIIEFGFRMRRRHIATANLFIEAVLIVAVVPLAHTPGLKLLLMLAAAMGLQTATLTLTRVGPLTIHTTFVTAMLNRLAQLLSRGAFLTYHFSRGRPEGAHRQKIMCQARLIGSIWILYLLGASAGTWLESIWRARALLLPFCCVLLAIGLDQLTPLSIEEEREESEG